MCFAFLQADSEFVQTFLHFYPVLVQLYYIIFALFSLLTCPDLESPEKLCLYPDRAILAEF